MASPLPDVSVNVALQKAVANTYALTALTQNAHWNVVGRDFFQLHLAFGAQYEDLFDTIDLLAERIRALGGFVKADLSYLNTLAGMPSLDAPFEATNAVNVLISAHDKNIRDLKALCATARAAGDSTTENMILSIIEAEDKRQWQLKSYVK